MDVCQVIKLGGRVATQRQSGEKGGEEGTTDFYSVLSSDDGVGRNRAKKGVFVIFLEKEKYTHSQVRHEKRRV